MHPSPFLSSKNAVSKNASRHACCVENGHCYCFLFRSLAFSCSLAYSFTFHNVPPFFVPLNLPPFSSSNGIPVILVYFWLLISRFFLLPQNSMMKIVPTTLIAAGSATGLTAFQPHQREFTKECILRVWVKNIQHENFNWENSIPRF